jgi:hypothetical protein
MLVSQKAAEDVLTSAIRQLGHDVRYRDLCTAADMRETLGKKKYQRSK